jgi:hypothetical protein
MLNHNDGLIFESKEKSMFLYAYRAFIDALGKGDKALLAKMTEPVLLK